MTGFGFPSAILLAAKTGQGAIKLVNRTRPIKNAIANIRLAEKGAGHTGRLPRTRETGEFKGQDGMCEYVLSSQDVTHMVY